MLCVKKAQQIEELIKIAPEQRLLEKLKQSLNNRKNDATKKNALKRLYDWKEI